MYTIYSNVQYIHHHNKQVPYFYVDKVLVLRDWSSDVCSSDLVPYNVHHIFQCTIYSSTQ